MKKKDETKIDKIQDAVAKIILKEGTAGVSTTKAAKIVGIAQSNVYLYFKNKNDLLVSVYQREMDRILNYSQFYKFTDESISIEEKINLYVKSIYEYSLEYPDSLTIIDQIKSLNIFDKDIYTTNNVVTSLLSSAIQSNYLKDLPVSLHMAVVFNVMHRHALNIKDDLYSNNEYSYEEISQMVLDAIKK